MSVALLVLASAQVARADQDPAGCSGTGGSVDLFVTHPDGTPVALEEGVSECAEVCFVGRIGQGTACAFQGNDVTITTPDGVDHIVYTDVPQIGGANGIPSIDTDSVCYRVRAEDIGLIVAGSVVATIDYRAAASHTGTSHTLNAPRLSTDVPVPVFLCDENDDVCDGVVTCDPEATEGSAEGICVTSDPLDCGESDECFDRGCDPVTGCFVGDELDCDDDNVCTSDSCDPAIGCVNEDTSECGTSDECADRGCDPITGCFDNSTADRCDDGDPCTEDLCDPATGCSNPEIVPPPPGCEEEVGQGCTPGFWKNNADKKGANAWPVSPGTQVNSVFTFGDCGSQYGTRTLLQALSLRGGSGVNGAIEILLRIGTGAYLNAVSDCVQYGKTDAEVVAAVNAALQSCDRATILALAAELDELNNAGCPIDQQGRCSNNGE